MQRHFTAVKAVIVNDQNQVLLVRESANDPSRSHVGKYDVPGGRLNFGEPPLEGLKREVREEVNMDVEIIKPIDTNYWMPTKDGEQWYIVAVFFLCFSKSIGTVSQFEHDELVWVDWSDLEKYNIIPTTKDVLKQYTENPR